MPEITVTGGEIPPDSLNSKYVEEDSRQHVHYMAFNNYDHWEGIHMVGVTSPQGFAGQSTAFVQLCAPTLVWVFKWTVSTFGDKPKIPDPTPMGAGWVLLQRLPEIPMVTAGIDGQTPLRRITGTYVYGKKNPSADPFKDASFPRPAFLEDAFDRVTGNLIYQKGMGDAGTTAHSTTGRNDAAIEQRIGFITRG